MGTARFGVCVSVLTPFGYRPFRAYGIVGGLPPDGQQLADVHVTQVDPYRAVYQPVHHRVGLHPAAEPPVPLRGRVPRTQHRGDSDFW